MLSTLREQDPLFLTLPTWLILISFVHYRSLSKNITEDEGEDGDELVQVHGVPVKFTKTKRGRVQFDAFGLAQYCLPLFSVGAEFLVVLNNQRRFFKLRPPLERFMVTLYFTFLILPQVDHFMPLDFANPTRKEQTKYRTGKDKIYRVPLYIWTFLEVLITFQNIKILLRTKMNLVDKFFLAQQTAFWNGAIGITIAHELVHKSSKLEKFLGNLLLCNVNYMHWGQEHLDGHHAHVATPKDPASAKRNQTVYSFFPQTFLGSLKSSWDIENKMLKKKKISKWNVFKNPNARNFLLPILYAFGMSRINKTTFLKTLGLFYLMGLSSATYLEIINYLEHYSLERKKLINSNGEEEYEPVDPTHSWNSPHRISNSLLFKLQRHSDHHTYARRPYHLLRNFQESPQLPTGYPGMFALALVPPAFFWVMNPLVKAHDDNKERIKREVENFGEYEYAKSPELLAAEKLAKSRFHKFISISGILGFLLLRKIFAYRIALQAAHHKKIAIRKMVSELTK
eukprot:snap_masked-scaffold_49-processed-gene-1.63-mRNA-1 protein AED:0.16 eAED:0.16 QI:0/-1/0/1/-1/1/1/0/510